MQILANSMQRAQPFRQPVLDSQAAVDIPILNDALIAPVTAGRLLHTRVPSWCHA
jgi:hypothetical protein